MLLSIRCSDMLSVTPRRALREDRRPRPTASSGVCLCVCVRVLQESEYIFTLLVLSPIANFLGTFLCWLTPCFHSPLSSPILHLSQVYSPSLIHRPYAVAVHLLLFIPPFPALRSSRPRGIVHGAPVVVGEMGKFVVFGGELLKEFQGVRTPHDPDLEVCVCMCVCVFQHVHCVPAYCSCVSMCARCACVLAVRCV